jgi:hypothetical protein
MIQLPCHGVGKAMILYHCLFSSPGFSLFLGSYNFHVFLRVHAYR